MLFLDAVNTLLLFLIKSVCAPPPAQTLLPPLGDVITTSATQVTVSAEGIMGTVDQWPSLHTEQPAAQLQSKKRGQSQHLLLSHLVIFCHITSIEKEPLVFSNISGRKPRHRRPESPTPDITVKKDKYNKGDVMACFSVGIIMQVLLNKWLSIVQDMKLGEEPRLKLSESRKEYITMLKCLLTLFQQEYCLIRLHL